MRFCTSRRTIIDLKKKRKSTRTPSNGHAYVRHGAARILFFVLTTPIVSESQSHTHTSSKSLQFIQKASDRPNDARGDTSLPVVQLPESGAILHSLLTFIFPVTPIVPSTTEKAMGLLSVAQKYQIVPVMIRIWDRIAQQNPPSSRLWNVHSTCILTHKSTVFAKKRFRQHKPY